MSSSTPLSLVVLVTGSTDGIGRETARQLVSRGAQVVVHGRDGVKVQAVSAELAALCGRAQPQGVVFDLADFAAIRRGAAQLVEQLPRLDRVIHNAGVFSTAGPAAAAAQARGATGQVDPLERSWQVNHLAPLLLTHELLPLLLRSAPARVVVVASVAHNRGQIHWDHLQQQTGYAAYAQSKLANVMFARALAQRFDAAQLSAFSLHPGVVGTKLLREGFGMDGPDSLQEGAATSVYCALAPGLEALSGQYFARSQPAQPAPQAGRADDIERLWRLSCQQVGVPVEWGVA